MTKIKTSLQHLRGVETSINNQIVTVDENGIAEVDQDTAEMYCNDGSGLWEMAENSEELEESGESAINEELDNMSLEEMKDYAEKAKIKGWALHKNNENNLRKMLKKALNLA